jgi:hypothetical protein
MDVDDIRRLATTGIAAFPPTALESAADWLWDFGEATGDARYCSLSRTIGMIADAFEDTYESLPNSVVGAVDIVLSERLPEVLSATSSRDGSALARLTREAVAQALSSD